MNGQDLPQHRPSLTAGLTETSFLPKACSFLTLCPSTLLIPAPCLCPFYSLCLEFPPLPLFTPAFLITPLLGALQISLLSNRSDFHLSSDLRLPEGRDHYLLPDSSVVWLWWPGRGGWGKVHVLDGKRGAKNRVDREGGWGQDREVDGRGQGTSSWAETPPQRSCSVFTPGPL